MLSKPAVSVGLGLIYKFDPIRLEVNFGVPLVASKSDSMRRGFPSGDWRRLLIIYYVLRVGLSTDIINPYSLHRMSKMNSEHL